MLYSALLKCRPAQWAIALLETRLCVCSLCSYYNCFCYWRNKYYYSSSSLLITHKVSQSPTGNHSSSRQKLTH